MQHPSEDDLAMLAFDAKALPDAAEMERHVAECPQCADVMQSYRALDGEFRDGEGWDLLERATTISAHRESIRQLASQIASEDEEARLLLGESLRTPTSIAWLDIANRPRFRTGGVARRLIAAAHDACTREPLDALTFAEQAIEVAEHLPDDVYGGSLVFDLRGTAWKERANALRFLGRYDAALQSLDRASEAYGHVPASPLGPASVTFVRASILYERSELTDALRLAEASEREFAHLGDDERRMRARHLQANIRFQLQQIGAARRMYADILKWAEDRDDLVWIARESRTLGHCALEAGELDEADRYFAKAVRAFGELGETSEVTRTEWGIGRVLLGRGRIDDAIRYLTQVEGKLRRHGLVTDAALVAFHTMDGWYAKGRTREIAAKAAALIEVFTAAGMLTSALQAFAYLKEAAESGRVTPRVIEHVRQFVIRVEREPDLLFAPPPEDEAQV